MNKRFKILFIKQGSIGDVIMTTPLIRQIRDIFPNSEMDYLVGKTSSKVLKNNMHLDRIFKLNEGIFEKKRFFLWYKLIKRIRKEKYDLVFVLDKHWAFSLTTYLSGIKSRVGFKRSKISGMFLTNKILYKKVRHEIFYYLDLIKCLNLSPDYKDCTTELSIAKKDKKFAEKIWEKFKLNKRMVIAIAPGGGNEKDRFSYMRCWPIENYISEIKKILKYDVRIILVGSERDVKLGKKISSDIKDKNIINLIGKLTLNESAAVISKCQKVICNDSGAMHIAASSNKNIYSIFTITNPYKKSPLWAESKSFWLGKKEYNPYCELYGNYSFYEDIIDKILNKKINLVKNVL